MREDPDRARRARPRGARPPGGGGAARRRPCRSSRRRAASSSRSSPRSPTARCSRSAPAAATRRSGSRQAARLLGGRVVSLERDPEVAADWRANVADAGLEEWAELIEGDALETLAGLEDVFDVVFLDAKKDEYERYFELARQLVDPGGLVLADNVLSHEEMLGRLQPRPPERPHARQRHRPARQRARGDVAVLEP